MINDQLKTQIARFFTLLLFISSLTLSAQDPKRIELPLPNGSETYQTVPLGDKGVLLISKPEKNSYRIQKFDTHLESDWTVNGEIERNLDLVTTSYDGRSVFLLFSRYRSPVYQVVKVNVGPGFVENFVINTVDRFQITDFKTLGNSVFMAGTVRDEPVLMHSDLLTKQTKILPTTIKGANVIQAIEVDTTHRLVNVSFAVKRNREMKLIARSYDEFGKLYTQISVEPEAQYSLLNGRLQVLNDSVQILLGTYGYSNMQSASTSASQGFYISKIVHETVQFTRYHSFTDFKNFFNFMNDRQQEKMERRIRKKKDSGGDVKLNYRLLVHDIILKDDQYTMVAEVFYPEYRNNNNLYGNTYMGNPWMFGSPFGYGLYNPWLWNPYYGTRGMNNQQVFDGFVYTHAIVAGLDKNGKLLWDNSINFDKVKSIELREMVSVKEKNSGQIQLVYSHEGKVKSKLISGSRVVDDSRSVDLPLQLEGDKVKNTSTDDISYWFDNYYLAWGTQKITNSSAGDAKSRGRRNVFYLSKIAF